MIVIGITGLIETMFAGVAKVRKDEEISRLGAIATYCDPCVGCAELSIHSRHFWPRA